MAVYNIIIKVGNIWQHRKTRCTQNLGFLLITTDPKALSSRPLLGLKLQAPWRTNRMHQFHRRRAAARKRAWWPRAPPTRARATSSRAIRSKWRRGRLIVWSLPPRLHTHQNKGRVVALSLGLALPCPQGQKRTWWARSRRARPASCTRITRGGPSASGATSKTWIRLRYSENTMEANKWVSFLRQSIHGSQHVNDSVEAFKFDSTHFFMFWSIWWENPQLWTKPSHHGVLLTEHFHVE